MLVKRLIAIGAALLLTACVSPNLMGDGLDEVAADYVQMQLEIGEREPGYIDAYYGPAEWQAAAKSAPRSVDELANEAASLVSRARAIDVSRDAREQVRKIFLLSQLKAAQTRLRLLGGERLSFADEAEGLFGVRPELKPFTAYDPILARIDHLVPGQGALADRVDAFQNRFIIPKDRLKPVFDAAIAECKRRTVQHIALPSPENFTMEFVTGKSWSGYNWYKGDATSLIQINTDLPIRVSRAVDLGCHEGYPGHHAYNMLLEQKLAKERGWIEYTVYPLYSPQSLIAEGSANYGIDLAFPGHERLAYEKAVLYPLANLSTAEADEYLVLLDAMRELSGARFTIARDYLDGRITRPQAIELTRKYQLVSEARARQSIDFTDQYRSYVINYGLGQDMVRNHVEGAGASPQERWAAFERILSEPTLPSDLIGR
ncbi:MAG: hypothetical protein H0W74_01830 [Sphingosinicella sp.]|nr:hypothetical protein [Sphingosinicella sp.]